MTRFRAMFPNLQILRNRRYNVPCVLSARTETSIAARKNYSPVFTGPLREFDPGAFQDSVSSRYDASSKAEARARKGASSSRSLAAWLSALDHDGARRRGRTHKREGLDDALARRGYLE